MGNREAQVLKSECSMTWVSKYVSLLGMIRIRNVLPRVDIGSYLFVLILRRSYRAHQSYPDILATWVAQ